MVNKNSQYSINDNKTTTKSGLYNRTTCLAL